jgi:hypothetical protein
MVRGFGSYFVKSPLRAARAFTRLFKTSLGAPVGRKEKSSLPTNGRTSQRSSCPYTPQDSTKCRPPGVRALFES